MVPTTMGRCRLALLFFLSGVAMGGPVRAGDILTLSLGDAIALAEVRDSNVDRARRSRLIAELQVRNAKSQYLPTASVSVNASQSANGSSIRTDGFAYGNGLKGSFVGTLNASVDVPIDISGTIGRQVRATKMRFESAVDASDAAQANAVIDVQLAYLDAMRAEQQLIVDRSIETSIRSLIADSRRRVPTLIPYLNVELSNAAQFTALSVNQRETAIDKLKVALKLPMDSQVQLSSALPPSVEMLALPDDIDIAATQRVQAAKAQAELANLSVVQSRDSRRPSLSVGAYATQTFSGTFVDSAGNTSNRNYGLSLRLNLPVLNYDAGRSGNSRRVAELMAEQAEADAESTMLQSQVQLKQAIGNLSRAKDQLKTAPDPEAAAKVLSSSIRAYLVAPPAAAPGLVAQVTNARSAWRSAQLGATRARIDVATAYLSAARLAWSKEGSVDLRLIPSATTQ